MALTTCKACKREISTKAEKCPQCGEPQPKRIGAAGAISLLLVGGLVFFIVVSMNNQPRAPVETKPRITADCSVQEQRRGSIAKLVNQGYFEKIERPAGLMRVRAMPAFMSEATFDDKKTIMSMVSAFDICEGGEGLVILVDAMTGEDIGQFSEYGLSLE